MELLARGLAALVIATGCYSPSLRDCTVSCAGADDCAAGQVCGSDKLCAAPEVAGKCGMGMPGPDAAPEPDATVDAGATVQLRVQLDGKGKVDVMGIGMCSSDSPQNGDCTFTVPTGTARTAKAMGAMGEKFTRWTSFVCSAQGDTCTFTPYLFTSITARFDKPTVAPEIGR